MLQFEIKDGVAIIPEGTTMIGDYAFSGCSSLTSVTIPNSVTLIGPWVFEECSSLTSINIPANKTNYYKKRLFKGLHQFIVEVDI